MTTLIWFRDDLRIADHPALAEGACDPGGVVCVYLFEEDSPEVRPLGGAARWWLHHSLSALTASLADLGVPLVLRRGAAETVIPQLAAETAATRVLWNRRYGPERDIDARVKADLRGAGIAADSGMGNLLHEPWQVVAGTGNPYRVYTPFWKAIRSLPDPPLPLPAPVTLRAAASAPDSLQLSDLALLPTAPDWAGGLAERWTPGESQAHRALAEFLSQRADIYEDGRDFPDTAATSELSPHLRWGEISPRTVWHTALGSGAPVGGFLSELGWREFAWHTRFYHPQLHTRVITEKFAQFPWREPDADELVAWQQGRTGIPIVDAGMRELWVTGFMHNRVRMVTASFLTKHLLTDWRIGEAWFWDTLVDADGASNPFNWQWVAGTGLDAAPYFRVFNPLLQQQRFDKQGIYVDQWAPDSLLTPPIIDLAAGRRRALAAYDEVRFHTH